MKTNISPGYMVGGNELVNHLLVTVLQAEFWSVKIVAQAPQKIKRHLTNLHIC